jgi:hypothetical protein
LSSVADWRLEKMAGGRLTVEHAGDLGQEHIQLLVADASRRIEPDGDVAARRCSTAISGQGTPVGAVPRGERIPRRGLVSWLPVTNVGTVSHKIKAEVIDGNGNSFVMLDGTIPLNPNNSMFASKGFSPQPVKADVSPKTVDSGF